MRLKTGMSVRVISGNHKGKEGKILRVIKDRERVIIEGVNLIKKNIRDLLKRIQKVELLNVKGHCTYLM